MAFDNIPYALNSVRDIQPGVNALELNPNARCYMSARAAYAFFDGLGPRIIGMGSKAADITASGTAWQANPTIAGFGIKMAGSTGYFSGPVYGSDNWSRECLFVYGASGKQAISTWAGSPGSSAHSREMYVDASSKLTALIWDGGLKYAVGATTLVVGQVYHAVAVGGNSALKVYLNGVEDGSIAATDYTEGDATLVFGYSHASYGGDSANTLLWSIDYNAALSATDVMHRYLNQMEMFRVARPRIMVGAGAAPATSNNSTRFIRVPGASMGMTRISGG